MAKSPFARLAAGDPRRLAATSAFRSAASCAKVWNFVNAAWDLEDTGFLYVCMDGWMDEWMDGCRMYVCMYVCMDGWMDG